MKPTKYILQPLLTTLCALFPISIFAQEDIDRTVTVEREFQPTIQNAGKINVKPEVYEVTIEPQQVIYSDFSEPLDSINPTDLTPLGYAETTFKQPKPLNGFVRGGIGHSATLFDFNYRVSDKKDVRLDLNINHLGQWGRKTLSHSGAGINFSKLLRKTDIFFGVDARNIYFTRYGKYFQYTDFDKMTGNFNNLKHYSDFQKDDKQAQWEINTHIGVRSLPNAKISYLLQTGYEAFIMRQGSVENIINTKAAIGWNKNGHSIGGNAAVENHIFKEDAAILASMDTKNYYTSLDSTHYHAVKVEPYYAYTGKRFFIHAGVNLDFCIGKGKLFLPSPNVTFEAKITPEWLALYGGVTGNYSTSSVREHFQYLRYLHPENEIATIHNRTYNPVNALLGFKIRPINNLLIDLYGAYNYTLYDVFYLPDTDTSGNSNGYFCLVGSGHQHWTVGAKINYHFQDIINISLNGFYNIWTMLDDQYYNYGLTKGHILDRPGWGITCRIDAKIDSKWSLYSDNYFGGGQFALQNLTKVVKFKPIIDLNLGAQYNIDKWLSVFAQLNNFINRKHDVVYGYQSQGINFMIGASYSF